MPSTINIVVGIFGIGLIIHSIAISKSAKYYSFFSKTYFIEPVSKEGKEKVDLIIRGKEQSAQRYGLSVMCLGLGVIATLWSFRIIESISIPFAVLAAIGFILAAVFKLKSLFK